MNAAWLFQKGEGNIVCFFMRVGVVDSCYLTGPTWTFSIMAFDIEKLFNRDYVTMREEVVHVEREMCPSDAIKGADASSQLDALSVEGIQEGFGSFGPFWSWYHAKGHRSPDECSHLWRQVINLDDDGHCRWTPMPTFVKQIAIQTD